MGVFGPAVEALLKQILAHEAALAQLDGANKTAIRTTPSVTAAVSETVDWIMKLSGNRKLRGSLPFFFVESEVGKHVANQLL
eukprot:6434261-Pyramimonas_sp.AAC.1